MVKAVVGRQVKLGLDVVTDGEVGREGYYMHFIRNGVIGIDLEKLSDKVTETKKWLSKYYKTGDEGGGFCLPGPHRGVQGYRHPRALVL